MCGAVGHSSVHGAPSSRWRTVVATILFLALLATACTDDVGTSSAAEDTAVGALAPVIPEVTEPMLASSESVAVMPPTPRPRAGGHILVDLEGPITNRDATDVVLRTERGVELDRFRLSGAIDLHGEAGGRWALVQTVSGQWAIVDGTGGTLSLLSFPGEAPRTEPVIRGPVAYWNSGDTHWVVRLDGGEPIDTGVLLEEDATVSAVTGDGSHVLARGSSTYVIDTMSGQVTSERPTPFVAFAPDGTVAAVQPRDEGGAVLTVEAPDGSARREVALLASLGQPVPLSDGRVLVAGTDSALVDAGGGQSPIPPIVGVRSAPVVSADGRTVVFEATEGVTVVDVAAGTVTPIADTVGFGPLVGTGRWVWATSTDQQRPGALVVDTQTSTATTVLPDTLTTQVVSVTVDGSLAAIRSGPGGTDAVVVGVDGTPLQIPGDALVVDVALHPTGEFSAAALVVETMRQLLVAQGVAPQATVDTGRSPVWLRTTL